MKLGGKKSRKKDICFAVKKTKQTLLKSQNEPCLLYQPEYFIISDITVGVSKPG